MTPEERLEAFHQEIELAVTDLDNGQIRDARGRLLRALERDFQIMVEGSGEDKNR